MLEATLRNVGGSVMMTIPKAVLDMLGLSARDRVSLIVDDGKLVVEPRRSRTGRTKYTLEELMAQCDLDAPFDEEARAWLNAPPVGREVI